MRLTVLGAAREVTGSCLLLDHGHRSLLVDCGMYQGRRAVEDRNADPFPFDPRRLAGVVLTHAHIDHSGLLPRLVREGFRGPIHATGATAELCEVLLKDSAWLQEQEYARAQRHGRRRAPPPYAPDDVVRTLELFRPVRYEERFEPVPGVRVRLRDAGHILGSASVELRFAVAGGERVVVVSGDIGQPGRPILRDPVPPLEADVLVCESTYGNRDHKPLDATLDELVAAVHDTLAVRGGNVIVPAFAVGRTQELLYWFNVLQRQGRLRDLDIYVDSPMATTVTRITSRHLELFDEEARRLARTPTADGLRPRLTFVETVAESMSLNDRRGGAVIIAASGMCEGGRVRHHLRHHLGEPRNTVLFTGFQAAGTLGRAIVDGASQVRLFGGEVPVRAQVVTLGGFSAHADQSALLGWMSHLRRAPGRTLLVHGEPEAQQGLVTAIENRFGWRTECPQRGEAIVLAA